MNTFGKREFEKLKMQSSATGGFELPRQRLTFWTAIVPGHMSLLSILSIISLSAKTSARNHSTATQDEDWRQTEEE
jgi:hypothetical protein